jgi:hypothetical protein
MIKMMVKHSIGKDGSKCELGSPIRIALDIPDIQSLINLCILFARIIS